MAPIQTRVAVALLVVASLLLFTGCSHFDHDWAATAGIQPNGLQDITGRWQGTWQSAADGHSGGLRCIVTRVNETTYHAAFFATYASILHFTYDMNLSAHPQGEVMIFEGQSDLGPLAGGLYHYDGHANSTDFFANYKCSYDNGTFTMKRPGG